MIIVDTSVWIAFFRGSNRMAGKHLQELLDQDSVALAAPVRVEILSGASVRTVGQLRRLLSALPVVYPDHHTWQRIEEWIGKAIHAGEHFGMGDLLLGAIAADHGFPVWSLDHDFHRMESLGWITTYIPDG